MTDVEQPPKINRPVLQHVIAGLGDGLILVEPDGRIAWANQSALDMHRTEAIADFGGRRHAQNALRQSEDRFSKSFRHSPAPTAISRLQDFVVTEVNEAFLQPCGRNSEEVIGKTAAELGLCEDPKLRRALEQKLKDNTPSA